MQLDTQWSFFDGTRRGVVHDLCPVEPGGVGLAHGADAQGVPVVQFQQLLDSLGLDGITLAGDVRGRRHVALEAAGDPDLDLIAVVAHEDPGIDGALAELELQPADKVPVAFDGAQVFTLALGVVGHGQDSILGDPALRIFGNTPAGQILAVEDRRLRMG